MRNTEGETTDGQIRSDYCYSLRENNRCRRMERRDERRTEEEKIKERNTSVQPLMLQRADCSEGGKK